jgi:Stress responsive A/B Barrel Domain
MVLHIVSFKYKPEVDVAARQNHRERLRALSGLDGVLDFKVGEDFVRNERSYDTGLVVIFRDRAALDSYAVHPKHVPVAQLGRDLSAHIVAVDFDA